MALPSKDIVPYSAARNVTETKFMWKNRKLKRPYKRSFLIQMALVFPRLIELTNLYSRMPRCHLKQ
jgi:hypothetical protein